MSDICWYIRLCMINVYAYSDNNIADVILVSLHFSQDTSNFFIMEQNIIWPLNTRIDSDFFCKHRCKHCGGKKCELRCKLWRHLWPKNETNPSTFTFS